MSTMQRVRRRQILPSMPAGSPSASSAQIKEGARAPNDRHPRNMWRVAGVARVMRNVDTAAATPLGPTLSVTVVKSSSTNSIPTFGPHQRKTHGYKSGLSGYAYPSGISR